MSNKHETATSWEGYVTLPNKDVVTLSEWKSHHLDDPLDDAIITKFFTCEISEDKAAKNPRQIRTVISDEKVDRDSDVISLDGWDLKDYEQNPVVLWAHSYFDPPIARSNVFVQRKRLLSDDEFATYEQYAFAETIFQLVKGGFVNAKSVGMRPIKLEWNEEREGYDFQKQTLLEHSYVPVPANPRTLVVARSQGIDVQPVVEWALNTLDTWGEEKGMYIPKSKLEVVAKMFDSTPEFFDMSVADIETAITKTIGGTDMSDENGNDTTIGNSTIGTTTDPLVVTTDTLITFEVDKPEKKTEEVVPLWPEIEELDEKGRKYVEGVIAERRLHKRLDEEGFTAEEIEKILVKAREAQDSSEDVEEEGVMEFSLKELSEAIAEEVEDVKSAYTEVTGQVV